MAENNNENNKSNIISKINKKENTNEFLQVKKHLIIRRVQKFPESSEKPIDIVPSINNFQTSISTDMNLLENKKKINLKKTIIPKKNSNYTNKRYQSIKNRNTIEANSLNKHKSKKRFILPPLKKEFNNQFSNSDEEEDLSDITNLKKVNGNRSVKDLYRDYLNKYIIKTSTNLFLTDFNNNKNTTGSLFNNIKNIQNEIHNNNNDYCHSKRNSINKNIIYSSSTINDDDLKSYAKKKKKFIFDKLNSIKKVIDNNSENMNHNLNDIDDYNKFMINLSQNKLKKFDEKLIIDTDEYLGLENLEKKRTQILKNLDNFITKSHNLNAAEVNSLLKEVSKKNNIIKKNKYIKEKQNSQHKEIQKLLFQSNFAYKRLVNAEKNFKKIKGKILYS